MSIEPAPRTAPAALSALDRDRTLLVVVDVQEAFRYRIAGFDAIARRCAFLLDVARLLGVPVLACEQNPGRLGPSAREVVSALRGEAPVAKMTFDACETEAFAQRLEPHRDQILLVGIEAHVCLLQTALGLLRRSREVFLAVDATGSQRRSDAQTAIRRLERAGAVATTVESTAFELLGSADEPRFREAIALIVQELEVDRQAGSGPL